MDSSLITGGDAADTTMDEAFFRHWFRGFAAGLEALDEESRSRLLRPCAKFCADTGVVHSQQVLYRAVGGNRDAFYRNLHQTGDVRGEVIVPGKEYEIVFPVCGCDLHTAMGVNSPCLCECSRQSILYTAQTIWKKPDLRVETITTILSGASECRFRLSFPD